MRIHIVGAGGAGMSAIAKVLAGIGHTVTGSDLRGGSTLDRLEDFGVVTYTGHRPEDMSGVDLVVASSAVPDDDVDARHDRPILLRDNAQDVAFLALVAPGEHDDAVALLQLGRHQSTSGARLMIFMKFLARSSRTTGPKMRVPIGSF